MKQMFIIWLAIYPIITVLSYFLGPYIASFPMPVRTLIMTVIIVPLMVKFAILASGKLYQKVEGLLKAS